MNDNVSPYDYKLDVEFSGNLREEELLKIVLVLALLTPEQLKQLIAFLVCLGKKNLSCRDRKINPFTLSLKIILKIILQNKIFNF